MEKITPLHVVIQTLEEAGYKRSGYKKFPAMCRECIPEDHYYFNDKNYIQVVGKDWELDVTINHQKEFVAHIMLRRTKLDFKNPPGCRGHIQGYIHYRSKEGYYRSKEEVGFINFCKPDSLEELKGWLA